MHQQELKKKVIDPLLTSHPYTVSSRQLGAIEQR